MLHRILSSSTRSQLSSNALRSKGLMTRKLIASTRALSTGRSFEMPSKHSPKRIIDSEWSVTDAHKRELQLETVKSSSHSSDSLSSLPPWLLSSLSASSGASAPAAPAVGSDSSSDAANGASSSSSSSSASAPSVPRRMYSDRPYPASLPLVPLCNSRPGLPGSVFRWTWPRHFATQDALSAQLEKQQPYFALFLLKEGQTIELDSPIVQAKQVSDAQTTDATVSDNIVAAPSAALDANDQAYAELLSKFHEFGVMCEFKVDKIEKNDNSEGGEKTTETHVVVTCLRRVRMSGVNSIAPVLDLKVEHLDDAVIEEFTDVVQKENIQAHMQEVIKTLKSLNGFSDFNERQHLQYTPRGPIANTPGGLADHAVALSSANPSTVQTILSTTDLSSRLYQSLLCLQTDLKNLDMRAEIMNKVNANFDDANRRARLREQKKVIETMLGTNAKSVREALITKFNERLTKLSPSDDVKATIQQEIEKFEAFENDSSESSLSRNYIDWLTSIPWGQTTQDQFDIPHAEQVMNNEHYGLEDVKQRILEFIAVGKLVKALPQGKVMCLSGPPGVGKTSIGKSIADALGRKFFRFSVGGMEDVSEIKGHRRTYVGAMPGKFIQALKQCGSTNPVILIDEIDKIGRSHRGDPAAALLEALDPEQNGSFMDHYLDVPCDLSKVLFICTANYEQNIPHALADRMDFVRLSGYVLQEKLQIARDYLEPHIRKSTGVTSEQVTLTPDALESLIHWYCREPGVRNLNQQLEKILRKSALKVARNPEQNFTIDSKTLSEYVGAPLYTSDRMYTDLPVGVAMGLAYTQMGGSLVFIESTMTEQKQQKQQLKKSIAKVDDNSGVEKEDDGDAPRVEDEEESKGEVQIGSTGPSGGFFVTGQLGSVMKESSSISYTLARRYLPLLSPARSSFFSHTAIHMHVPEGATPKDGPSAGITMTCSLLSLALDTPLVNDVAMTGEVTLTGRVMEIGGLKEKVLAAKRANCKRVVFPLGNMKDWNELKEYVREGIKPVPVQRFDEVLRTVFPTLSVPTLSPALSRPVALPHSGLFGDNSRVTDNTTNTESPSLVVPTNTVIANVNVNETPVVNVAKKN